MGLFVSRFPEKLMIAATTVKMEPTIRLSDAETTLLIAEQTRDSFLEHMSGPREPAGTVEISQQEISPMPEFARFVVDSYVVPCVPCAQGTPALPVCPRVGILGLASILQCAPPGLKSWIYDTYPRAAIGAGNYVGAPLTCQDVGSSVVTCETIDTILAEYIGAAPRNILYGLEDSSPSGKGEFLLEESRQDESQKADSQKIHYLQAIGLVVKAVFSGLGHREARGDPHQGKYIREDKDSLSKKDRLGRHHNARVRVKSTAIKHSHWEVLAALELCGCPWTAADQIAAGGKTPLGKLIRYWRVHQGYRVSSREEKSKHSNHLRVAAEEL